MKRSERLARQAQGNARNALQGARPSVCFLGKRSGVSNSLGRTSPRHEQVICANLAAGLHIIQDEEDTAHVLQRLRTCLW